MYYIRSSDTFLNCFQAYEKGNISRHVSLLKIGDKLRVKGPKGKFVYSPDLSRELGMIAGGTGITPMLQIIRAALKNPEDKTKISLIYANVNPEDILLKTELDKLAVAHPTRFTVFYVLNNPPAGWTGGSGFVTKDQIEKHLPSSSHDIKVLLCGMHPFPQVATDAHSDHSPRSPSDDERDEVRRNTPCSVSTTDCVYRGHLNELKYTVPTGLSKLADQVTKSLFALTSRP